CTVIGLRGSSLRDPSPTKNLRPVARFTDTPILRARVEPSTASPCSPFAFSSSRTRPALTPPARSYTISRRKELHATRHAISPCPGHLRHSPRSPQNRPRRRRETPRRLRQHPHCTGGIALHLEGQAGTFPRTPAAHQDHRQEP